METLSGFTTVRLLVTKDQDNLFIRLSRDLLSTLLVGAVCCPLDGNDHDAAASSHPTGKSKEWRLETAAINQVSFLPLEIVVGDCTIYASYNGGLLTNLSPDEEARCTMQVPEGLLPQTSLDHLGGSSSSSTSITRVAQVRALTRVRYATRVQVDPLTTEDWELLQVHAERLEGGAFLKQISLVYRDQRLFLSLSTTDLNASHHPQRQQRRDTIHVTVQEISCTSNTERTSSPWPKLPPVVDDDDDENSITGAMARDDDENYLAVLTSDTEIIVTPKPRRAMEKGFDPSAWSEPFQVIPGSLDIPSDASTVLQDRIPKIAPLYLAPPGCVAVHPGSIITWDRFFVRESSQWVQITTSGNESNTKRKILVARLVLSAELPEYCTVVHPLLRWDLGLPLFWGHIQLRPIIVPLESLSFSNIELRKLTLKSSTWRPWHHPEIPSTMFQSLLDGLDERMVGNVEVPLGSIVTLSTTTDDSLSQGRPKKEFYRIVPRLSIANEMEGGIVCFQLPEQVKALIMLAATTNGSQGQLDPLERPSSDFLVSAIPRLIFDTTLDALSSFFCALRRDLPFLGILSGSTGSGKTHTAIILGAVARMEHRRATLYLDCKRLQDTSTTIVEILSELEGLFRSSADKVKKCLIILDDLDCITPNLLGGDEGDPGARAQGANPTAIDQSKLISDRILQLNEAANAGDSSVSVVVTCASESSLHKSICQNHKSVNLPALNSNERQQLFVQMLQDLGLSEAASLPDALFGQPTEGFRPRDLEKVAARVRRSFCAEKGASAMAEATEVVLRDFIPLSHMGLDKRQAKAGLTWDEIGGLFEVKKKLEATLLNPIKYRAIYERAKISLPRGVLLLGPTGCGKTGLVPALARKCKFPLISCNGPEILDKYIGASEAKIRELFKRAASVAPSILFLDELDALAPRRGSDHTGVTDRVVNQLLTFLDGVEDTSNATVYVIGASSRPDKIDPALLRPGRLEQHLFVGPPDADEEWIDLFHKIANGCNLAPDCQEYFFTKGGGIEEVLAIVKKNPLFCPADIKAAMHTAQLNAVHRILNLKRAEDVDHIEVEIDDLRLSLSKMRPCLSPDDARMLTEIYKRYYHAKGRETRSPSPTPHQLNTTLR